MTYKVSPVTDFDQEQELFGTKVGKDNRKMALTAIVYGETEEESKEMAEKIVQLLNKQ